LQKKVQEILDCKRKYLETAIRDAHAAGQVYAPDAASKARTLFLYYQGLLTQARIENNLAILQEAMRGTCDVLGVRECADAGAPV
jgi:TetR/AcrR family transcriptional repressor of nem operon